MRIATYNINGIKARLNTVRDFLRESDVDVAVLQEIKSMDENFPAEAIEELGYNVVIHGQKGFNGVALLSKHPVHEVRRGLAGDDTDEQARYIEAEIEGLTICGLYLPNGNPVPGPKFDYKLSWMKRLRARAEALLAEEQPFLITGDFNIIPEPDDAHDIEVWRGDALYHPETLAEFRKLSHLGLRDAFRLVNALPMQYSFWDFQAGAWNKNNGIRIDHFLTSPELTDKIGNVSIEKEWRGREKPSDHVPVILELNV